MTFPSPPLVLNEFGGFIQYIGQSHTKCWPLPYKLQKLGEARERATAAGRALKEAQKAVSTLEVSIPKARLEATSQQATADDLQKRLSELQAATQVDSSAYVLLEKLTRESPQPE